MTEQDILKAVPANVNVSLLHLNFEYSAAG